MRYGEGLLEEILRRTDLVALVGRSVKLSRRGHIFWGLCPFHKEKSPSFKVEAERRNYKCFGCGAGGDAFKWLMETEGLLFPEAVERLAQDAGVELPKWTPQDETREQQKKSLYSAIETATEFFEQQLRGSNGAGARSYLQSRGLAEDACRQFHIGYAPSGRRALLDHLKTKGFSEDDAVAAGLARRADGQPARDFFFDRVIFPIGDARGRIVAFGARALHGDVLPKYINTGETSLFSKGKLLYNFATARIAALKSGSLIVAEGYLDVIALVRAGFEAAVAPLGTALTGDHLALLWRSAPEPTLSFDGDEAGRRAAFRAAELALPLLAPGHSLRFAFLPSGEDPDSLLRAEGAGAMQAALEKAIPMVEMVWQMEAGRTALDTPERKAAFVSRLNERLKSIPVADVRRFYLSAFVEIASRELGLRTFAAGDELRVSASSSKRRPEAQTRTQNRAALTPALKSNKLVSGHREHDTEPGGMLRAPAAMRAPPPLRVAIGEHRPDPAVRRLKEMELMALLLDAPWILERHHEQLAALPLADSSLDNLRHELLQLAASGIRLETGSLEGHLERAGMGWLIERLKPRRVSRSSELSLHDKAVEGGSGDSGDFEARWVRAAAQLLDMSESDAERRRALERFKSEASEESWRDWHRLVLSRELPGK
ncbi:MAG TPA: DNA primase [Rhizomicrobium sp.]|jgi:DNA primase